MSTNSDGTNFAKMLGMGYYMSKQCNVSSTPGNSFIVLLKDSAVIYNHPSDTFSLITDLMSSNKAVVRTCIEAGEKAIYELKNKRLTSVPIDAVYNKDRQVLHLLMNFPANASRSYTFSMINASGAEVYAQSWGAVGGRAQYAMDAHGFPKGRYYLKLSQDQRLGAKQDISLD